MKVAIIGSRSIEYVDLFDYLPKNTTVIISGGAKGIDKVAKEYAKSNDILLREFKPEYDKYRRNAPLVRNLEIIRNSDLVLAFWDGKSKGTKHVIDNCKNLGVMINIFYI